MLASNVLRPAKAIAIRFQPALFAPCSVSAASFSTSTRPAKVQRTERPFFASRTAFPIQTAVKHASTAPGASAAAANMHSTASSGASKSQNQLTWNGYFALRRTRRRFGVVASGISAVATTFAGLSIFIQSGYDSSLAASFNLDPIIVTGLSSVAMLSAGWLIGPTISNQIFNLWHRRVLQGYLRKEREFFNRIKHHRVDPTSSSMANPVPDYYGEKIGSVAGYRRWLKDQRAFNLKRGAYQGGK